MNELGDMIPLIAAVLFGLAAAGVVIARHGSISRFLVDERRWIRETALRFSPDPVDARQWQLFYLAARATALVLLVTFIANLIVAVIVWIALLKMPKLVIESMWEQRRKKIDEQLAPAVLSMSQCVHAGLTLVQAIHRLAENSPEPIRTEFRIIANRYALGANLESAILASKQRLGLANYNLFASALLVNREMGGNVSITLERIAESLESLKELRLTVVASTSEGRTIIKMLCLAPFFVLGFLFMLDPEGAEMMFNTPQGVMVLAAAAALTGFGVFWASRIVSTDL